MMMVVVVVEGDGVGPHGLHEEVITAIIQSVFSGNVPLRGVKMEKAHKLMETVIILGFSAIIL